MVEAALRQLAQQHNLDPATLDALLDVLRLQEEATRVPGADGDGDGDDASEATGAWTPRYTDLGLLGQGGMGEVRRVLDHRLSRVVALKTIRPEQVRQPGVQERFLSEASAAAQLQHPGIIPVHDVGWLPDGRPFFTMKEVRGRTLKEIVQALHRESRRAGRWQEVAGWTLRRLVLALRQTCEAIAYAHVQGVIHRDIKPSNIMIGDFGEVLVMDWGLVRSTSAPAEASAGGATVGAGTPSYMAPEQAQAGGWVGPHTDIYGLGAVLYEILCGSAPHAGGRGGDGGARPLLVGAGGGLPLPEILVDICVQAMSPDPAERHGDARALGQALQDWLDGVQAQERGRQVVWAAEQLCPQADALRAEAAVLEQEAAARLEGVASWAPASQKQDAWALQDRAAEIRREASLLAIDREVGLRTALSHDPLLPEAHTALALLHQAAQIQAEAADDTEGALASEVRLQGHLRALPPDEPVRARLEAWLVGDGRLTLHTDPPGATVTALRYVERGRRLHPEPLGVLGQTPLEAVRLPRGSYLLHIEAPGHARVRYPVSLGRQEHWDGCPPGADRPLPVPLPRLGALSSAECYVPPGWFWSGGRDEAGVTAPVQRLWCGGLILQRFPVTVAEYLTFLNDLVARGEDALPWAPRERAGTDHQDGALIFGQDGAGRFHCIPDGDGDIWHPDYPMIMVDPVRALAYCRWRAAREGLPWRLPAALEWEKAGRGVDRRLYTWGSFAEPSWACNRQSSPRPFPAVVDSYPVDESPYGVRGMVGNVRDLCGLPLQAPRHAGGVVVPGLPPDVDPQGARHARGGNWGARLIYGSLLTEADVASRYGFVGFRLCRTWPVASG